MASTLGDGSGYVKYNIAVLMDAYQARFASSLRALIEAKIVALTELLVTTPAPDYPAYTERVGHIRAMRETLKTMDDVERDLSKGERAEPELAAKRRSYED